MKSILIAALISAITLPVLAAVPMPSAPPLTVDQKERVRCVAALAIVASEQVRGVGDWNRLPPLQSRGSHFAGVIGDALTGEGGRTREAVRDAIVAEVAMFQKARETSLPAETVFNCIALMDRLDPPPPPPGLTECAALVSLAAKETQAREGLSDTAKLLVTFAAVLDNRAREKLRIEGNSESENDVVIGLKKEELLAAAKTKDGAAGPDMSACLELAKP